MDPPLRYELLDELDAFIADRLWLLETAPDEFVVRLRSFVTYLICRSIREGRRGVIRQEPGRN
jgi:hypothetical protein